MTIAYETPICLLILLLFASIVGTTVRLTIGYDSESGRTLIALRQLKHLRSSLILSLDLGLPTLHYSISCDGNGFEFSRWQLGLSRSSPSTWSWPNVIRIRKADWRTASGSFGTAHHLMVGYTAPVIALAMICCGQFSAFLIRRGKTKKHTEAGACPACGYDCRATPDRCPECGHAALAPADATTPNPPQPPAAARDVAIGAKPGFAESRK